MILQVDIVPNSSNYRHGFYRIMARSSRSALPNYWMFNGVWHTRTAPNLNPPDPWYL